MRSITQFIERRLKLKINSRKSSLCQEGYESNRKRIPEFHLHREENPMDPEVSRPIQIQDTQVDQSSLGCLNGAPATQAGAIYSGLDGVFRPIPLLDQWIRRRIRCCFLKQWRKPKTRFKNLVRLGVDKVNAASSKGYYRLSITYAVQQALNNSYLAKIGLVSLKDLWIRFHHPR